MSQYRLYDIQYVTLYIMYLIINYCVLRKLLKIYNILEWVNYQNSQEKELP